MPTLPESGLDALNVADHVLHHELIADTLNKILDDALAVGDALVKTSAGTGVATVGAIQPHYTHPNQVKTVAHSTAGALILAVTRDTKAMKVNASADITSLSVTGMELLGLTHGSIRVLIEATASIAVSFTAGSLVVINPPPSTLASGQSARFELERWNVA